MSWEGMLLLMWRGPRQRNEKAEVALGKLREVVFLKWYMRPGDEKLAPEEFGRRIDDGLVESIRTLLPIKHGDSGIEEFKSRVRQIEEGMRENMALKAFAATLRENSKGPLASKTYLQLARRHALYGGKPPPSSEQGRRFASVLLAPFMEESSWEFDWNSRIFTEISALDWLGSRDPHRLRELIRNSEVSPVAWDALQLICQELAGGDEEEIPCELLWWSFGAAHGHAKRPDEVPAPTHRPRKPGYKLRNNELRHTVALLVQVGMPKSDACCAVAKAVHFSTSTILRICREPNSSIEELASDAMNRMEPYLHGPGSNSGPSSST